MVSLQPNRNAKTSTIFPITFKRIPGLRDSKLLTKSQRQKLEVQIYARALSCGVGRASATEVDRLGLTEAIRLAMHRAVVQIPTTYEEIMVNGDYNFFAENPQTQTLIDADDSVPVVSATSIIAKVARDAWMIGEAAGQFPQYGFERHVGLWCPLSPQHAYPIRYVRAPPSTSQTYQSFNGIRRMTIFVTRCRPRYIRASSQKLDYKIVEQKPAHAGADYIGVA